MNRQPRNPGMPAKSPQINLALSLLRDSESIRRDAIENRDNTKAGEALCRGPVRSRAVAEGVVQVALVILDRERRHAPA